MNALTSPDSLHRLVKHAIDSGAAASIEEAHAVFRGYRLAIEVHATAVHDSVLQAALLTTIALGRRVFLGGVTVSGPLDAPLVLSMPLGRTLADAVVALGGTLELCSDKTPTIVIGGGPGARRDGFCVRTATSGWRGGVLPFHSDLQPTAGPAMPLSGMLSAALAVNEAYLHVSGGMPAAGHRVVGLSLWHPGSDAGWFETDMSEPALSYLPSRMWLIGLGHLGQAYLWGLGLLPYREPADLSLVLQDIDLITASTVSTSILSDGNVIGQRKTRAMAAWAERRGFTTSIQERLFAADFKRQPEEPTIALCGLDNVAGRRALDQVGFDLVVEAGLGRGYRDFRSMRLHLLPGRRPAAEIWKAAAGVESVEARPAYAKLIADGAVDRCGMTLLAGKAVGAPFVGSVAACLALSEVLRLLHGGVLNGLIDLNLLSLDQRIVWPYPDDLGRFNPGFSIAE